MLEMLKQFIQDEEGVTAIEYGLIASLIAIMIIAGSTTIGQKLDQLFTYIGGQLKTSPPAAP